jgi:hypothetical protein
VRKQRTGWLSVLQSWRRLALALHPHRTPATLESPRLAIEIKGLLAAAQGHVRKRLVEAAGLRIMAA